MVSEDPETYDTHANVIGGWPTLVDKVLEQTHNLDYDPENFSKNLHVQIEKDVTTLLTASAKDSQKPQGHKLGKGGQLPKMPGASAEHISFGIKAPISMTLVPWFAHVVPHFR